MRNTNFDYNVLVNCKVGPSQIILIFGCSLELPGEAFKNSEQNKNNPKDSTLTRLGYIL